MTTAAYIIAALGFLAIHIIEQTVHCRRHDDADTPADAEWLPLLTLLL